MQKIKVDPVGDRIIVEPAEHLQKLDSGIILPDMVDGESSRGTVRFAGPGLLAPDTGKFVPMDLKVGDEIFYSRYGHTDITIAGKEYLAMKATTDVIARVEEIDG